MTVVETMNRRQATRERDALARELQKRLGTDDRTDLRRLSLTGGLSDDDVTRVERLRVLDYLLED